MHIHVKKTVVALLGILVLVPALVAGGPVEGYYLKLSLGQPSFDETFGDFSAHFSNAFEGDSLAQLSYALPDGSGALSEGFVFSPYLFAEVGLNWWGDGSVTGTSTSGETAKLITQIYGLHASLNLQYSLSRFTGFAGVGGVGWQAKRKLFTPASPWVPTKTEDQGFSLFANLGIQFHFNGEASIEVSWQKTEVDEIDLEIASLGFVYRY